MREKSKQKLYRKLDQAEHSLRKNPKAISHKSLIKELKDKIRRPNKSADLKSSFEKVLKKSNRRIGFLGQGVRVEGDINKPLDDFNGSVKNGFT